MKECIFKAMLSAYLDGELSEHDSERLRLHLEQCEDCRSELESLRSANNLLKGLPDIEPSQDFERSFWLKTQRYNVKKTWMSHVLRLLSSRQSYAAAAGIALLIGGYLFLSTGIFPPSTDDIQIATNLGLLKEFEIVSRLDLLENLDVIMEFGEK